MLRTVAEPPVQPRSAAQREAMPLGPSLRERPSRRRSSACRSLLEHRRQQAGEAHVNRHRPGLGCIEDWQMSARDPSDPSSPNGVACRCGAVRRCGDHTLPSTTRQTIPLPSAWERAVTQTAVHHEQRRHLMYVKAR